MHRGCDSFKEEQNFKLGGKVKKKKKEIGGRNQNKDQEISSR
jgi:hypothetical protein